MYVYIYIYVYINIYFTINTNCDNNLFITYILYIPEGI